MRTAVLLLLLSTMVGCDALAGQSCTGIGGTIGVWTEIAEELWVAEGDVSFTVCVADCSSATQHLPVRPKRITGGLPEERSALVDFEDLGRSFDDGMVRVTVELRDDIGRLVARREQDVELTRSWPNGKDCDGDGYVSGHLEVSPEDAVAGAA